MTKFTHIVLFKLKDPTADNISTTTTKLRDMIGKIPSLRSLEVGENEIVSDRAYDISLIARFENLAGLKAYQAHPVHQEVLTHIREVSVSTIAVDYHN